MRKIFLTTVGLVTFSLALMPLSSATAGTVTFSTDTTLTLPSISLDVTVLAGGIVESLTLQDDGTIDLTFGADTDITIRSTDMYSMISSNSGTVICMPGQYNQVEFSNETAGGTTTVTVTSAVACIEDSSGGGGGGGTPPAAPTGTSVSIDSDASETDSVDVTLTLAATNAATMLISNYSDFSDADAWEDYTTSKSWTLLEGVGTRTVYVKFRSSSGSAASAVSDSIELVEEIAESSGEIDDSSGGSASLSDGSVSVSVPAAAVSGSGTVSINPTTSYTAPGGDKQVVGGKSYDLAVTIDDAEVTVFTEPVTLTFSYNDSDISGLDESTLAIYYWDEDSSQWVEVGGTVDAGNNTITATVNHFTMFAILGEEAEEVTPSAGTGTLIKLACGASAGVNDPCRAVYYLGNDGKRYVFPNEKTYKTWYSNFSGVEEVSAEEMASHFIGGNVTYRPGVKLVKIQTNPKVYAVDANGTLRWVSSGAVAEELYGSSWNLMVEDVPDPFFINYTEGADIESASDYNKVAVQNAAVDINTDKGL